MSRYAIVEGIDVSAAVEWRPELGAAHSAQSSDQ